VPRTDNLLKMP